MPFAASVIRKCCNALTGWRAFELSTGKYTMALMAPGRELHMKEVEGKSRAYIGSPRQGFHDYLA
jgi:hypothetical protein